METTRGHRGRLRSGGYPFRYAVGVLGLHCAERPDVYVSGDLLIYHEEGNPRVSVAPDAFVVFGVEDRVRMNYYVISGSSTFVIEGVDEELTFNAGDTYLLPSKILHSGTWVSDDCQVLAGAGDLRAGQGRDGATDRRDRMMHRPGGSPD